MEKISIVITFLNPNCLTFYPLECFLFCQQIMSFNLQPS